MPHPVKRTSAAPRPVRASRPARKGRRVLALLGGIAVASAAVLGLLQLTGGPSETSQTVAGPQAKSPAPRARQPASKPKPKPKPKPAVRTAPSPARPSASATKKPSPTPKPKARATPKAAAGVSPKPTTSAEPKAPAAPKTRTATQPRTPPAAPRPTPKTAKAVPATAPGAPPAARRFAWAPVEGAIGYHVELFRGAERVLVRETKEPVLELGPTWRYQGRTVTLTPGAYRWYVWPVTKSGRATQAVVQAKLTV
ncbi:MAG: hypothetical protein M5U27_06350 [Gaiella sp.]|nr:hypothetical protein [Gaiella sp.]